MNDGLTREEVYDAIDSVISDFLEQSQITQPPIDALTLARTLPPTPVKRVTGRKQAVANAEPTEERRHWLAAHAVGEYLQPRVLAHVGIESAKGLPGISLPNVLADRLLTPDSWFADLARSEDYDLLALKKYFSTAGYELLALRMLDLSEACIITIVDNGSIHVRRANAFRAPKALSPAESRCAEVVHRTSRAHQLNQDGWRVQGWPIHSVDWRREVLRSVVDEEALSGREYRGD